MLKGILCMDHSMDRADSDRARQLFDTQRIAERMDEITMEAYAAAAAAKKAA